jgi:hypothetical protein
MTLTRISITIPEKLVRAADKRAKELDRSRSWVLVEALRRYLSDPSRVSRGRGVREEATRQYGEGISGLGDQRTTQLEADLRLTPEQRVREAERTLRVSELLKPSTRHDRVITFDTYEDYLRWTDREDVTP